VSGAFPPRAYLHIGAPKTGSTFLQGLLWANRTALRDAGLDVLGPGQGMHYRAGHDLRDIPFDPNDPGVDWTGAWDQIVRLAQESDAASVIISDEHLASLTREQIQRAVSTLTPRETHVIYGARDLTSLIPSEWQEYVKHGSTATYEDWARSVLESQRRGPGRWFWSVHDPLDVVERWSGVVAPQRFHLVTMPPPDAPRDTLWHRFATVLHVPAAAAPRREVAGNPSLGWAEAEFLRRVNEELPEDLPRWHRSGLVRDVLATRVLATRQEGIRPTLPSPLASLVVERAQRTVEGLRATEVDVVGGLEELTPDPSRLSGGEPPTEATIAAVGVHAAAGLVRVMATMRDDRRRAERKLRAESTSRTGRLRSRVRTTALAAEARSEMVHRLLQRYRDWRSSGVSDAQATTPMAGA